ncbi:peptidase M6 [Streptomyces sp. NPDC054796]
MRGTNPASGSHPIPGRGSGRSARPGSRRPRRGSHRRGPYSRRAVTLAGATALATAALALMPVDHAGASVMSGPCAVVPGPGFDEGPPGPGFVRPQGDRKAVMIMVDFPDLPARGSPSRRASFFSDFTDDYLAQASHGRYRLDLEPTDGWVRMPRAWASYGIGRGVPTATMRAYVQDALDAAERRGTDFTGTEMVYVVADDNVPAPPTVSQANTFTGLRAGHGLTGTSIRGAALVFGRSQDAAVWQRGNFVHEANHLYGLPDLYDTGEDASVRHAGGWDTMSMAGISDLMGWHKWKFGWLDTDRVGCVSSPGTSEHELRPVASPGGGSIAVVRTGPSRAVVAEARTRTGLDRGICAEGVLLYTVDSRVPTGRGPVRVVDATPRSGGGPACSDRDPGELAELADAPFRPGGGHTFPDGVHVRVTGVTADGYAVRVTRR